MIWEDGSGSAEREIARLEAVGELDGVVLHIVHWQTDEAIAAANELMRKLKATREQGGLGRCRWEEPLCRSPNPSTLLNRDHSAIVMPSAGLSCR
jgi:hypothetical protein